MNRFLKLLSLCLFLTLTVPLQAVTNGVANEPDSVYLFSYSPCRRQWRSETSLESRWQPMVQRGRGQLLCQLGLRPLGANEADAETALDADPCRRPLALYLGTDGKRKSLAYVESPDLLQWKAQKYFDRSRLAEYRPAEVYPNVRKEVLLNGTVQQGWMQRVPYATVQRVISFVRA